MNHEEKTYLFQKSIGKQFKVGPLKNTIRKVTAYHTGETMVDTDNGSFNIVICDLIDEELEQAEFWATYDKLIDAATSIGYAEDTARAMVRKRFKIEQIS